MSNVERMHLPISCLTPSETVIRSEGLNVRKGRGISSQCNAAPGVAKSQSYEMENKFECNLYVDFLNAGGVKALG